MKQSKLLFGRDFLWGAATSAHQVEGNNHNQWTRWENENARKLAANAKRKFGHLDNWKDIRAAAENPENYISGQAANHYEKYETDFQMMKKLGLNAFRFSVEWSRCEPTAGKWSAAEFAHYKRYLKSMKSSGIEPVMTLFHFTLPEWFQDLGGFEKRANVKYFVRFAEKVLKELGGQVRYVITINEPEVYAGESYLYGNWPPQQTSKIAMIKVLRNLAYAHNEIAKTAHAMGRRFKVSVATNSGNFHAGDDAWLSQKSAAIMQWGTDDFFLKKVVKNCDFLGVNYYFTNRVYGYRIHNSDQRTSDLGWDLQPADIEHVLMRLSEKYNLPLMICENGLADASDENRKWWMTETILAMNRVLDAGVNVLGYLHWSLLDNFEWDKGFWPRFGLIEVDYENDCKRTVRKSALWYGRFVRKVRGL